MFDGEERVEAPHAAAYNFAHTDAFSGVAWVRPADLDGNEGIIEKTNEFGGDNDGRGWGMNISGDEMMVRFDHIEVTNGITKTTDGANLQPNTWYHMVYTYDGSVDESGLKFYLNGSHFAAETLISNTLNDTFATTRPLRFGARGYVGHLDEIAVYAKELSAAEVSSLYNSGEVADYRDLIVAQPVFYSRMGEGSAYPTLVDVISSNNGAMINMEARDLVLRP